MLTTEMQKNPWLKARLEQIVRANDRVLAGAAARMNVEMLHSLMASRILTAIALTVSTSVVVFMRTQGDAIGMQQQTIRLLFDENQKLIHYRLKNPPAAPSMPASNWQHPATAAPASNVRPSVEQEEQPVYRADGCVEGVCA
ncbi:MAG: hypothetical protein JO041_00110 [Acidobacteria bacterium]|nr:hypothetical protein [Acidobacteriota bacterium]